MKFGDLVSLIFFVIPFILLCALYDAFEVDKWYKPWTVKEIPGGRKVREIKKKMGLDK